MASAGEVSIQGCAFRLSRLNADGSITGASATGMVVDDKPLVKVTLKPSTEAGGEIVPKSACGVPMIAYKDFDRQKRWDCNVDLSDMDFDKREIITGGSLLTAATSSGRTVADGVTTLNSTHITSATGAFVSTDVGRSATGTGIPATAYIVRVVSATEVVLSLAATASASGLSIVFGAIASRTIGYAFPQLLTVGNQYGVGLEVWQKAIVRGTGFQGTTPYPSVGSLTPALTGSAFVRWGFFRWIPTPDAFGIEDKETMSSYAGWCIENPNFGTGPVLDWTTTAVAGGPPVDTTRWCNAMMDFQLPSPLQPGYQSTT